MNFPQGEERIDDGGYKGGAFNHRVKSSFINDEYFENIANWKKEQAIKRAEHYRNKN